MAITTYALHVVNSPEKDNAFNMLLRRQRTSKSSFIFHLTQNFSSTQHFLGAGGIYWSNVELLSNRLAFVAITERLAPKYESELEAHAIAATSFALLTYMMRVQTVEARPIVHWLQTRRNFVAGWCSSYDSFFALKSLVQYAIRHGDTIQEYNFRMNISSSDSVFKTFDSLTITDDNIIELHTIPIEKVYGRALIDAYGTGYALVQVCFRSIALPETLKL